MSRQPTTLSAPPSFAGRRPARRRRGRARRRRAGRPALVRCRGWPSVTRWCGRPCTRAPPPRSAGRPPGARRGASRARCARRPPRVAPGGLVIDPDETRCAPSTRRRRAPASAPRTQPPPGARARRRSVGQRRVPGPAPGRRGARGEPGRPDEHAVALARRATPLVESPALHVELARVRGIAEIQRGRPSEVAAALVEAAREVITADQRKRWSFSSSRSSPRCRAATRPP